jgi:hypothetical protein
MMQNTFEEKQHLRAFIAPIVFAIVFVPVVPLLKDLEPFWMIVIPAETTLLLLLWLVATIQLKTKIEASGVTYKFAPFISTKHIGWKEIAQANVTDYQPIKEFGGWGFRAGFAKKQALSIWGKQALRLKLKDGRELVLGTQRPEELSAVVQCFFPKAY